MGAVADVADAALEECSSRTETLALVLYKIYIYICVCVCSTVRVCTQVGTF